MRWKFLPREKEEEEKEERAIIGRFVTLANLVTNLGDEFRTSVAAKSRQVLSGEIKFQGNAFRAYFRVA